MGPVAWHRIMGETGEVVARGQMIETETGWGWEKGEKRDAERSEGLRLREVSE